MNIITLVLPESVPTAVANKLAVDLEAIEQVDYAEHEETQAIELASVILTVAFLVDLLDLTNKSVELFNKIKRLLKAAEVNEASIELPCGTKISLTGQSAEQIAEVLASLIQVPEAAS